MLQNLPLLFWRVSLCSLHTIALKSVCQNRYCYKICPCCCTNKTQLLPVTQLVFCKQGKGTEDVNRYRDCKLLYLDIANIHSMRDSIDKLQLVCEGTAENKWLSQLESTQWLTHMSNVIRVSNSLFIISYCTVFYVTELDTISLKKAALVFL